MTGSLQASMHHELLTKTPEFVPVWKRDLELWPHRHILDALAFFLMDACSKAADPQKPGPEFEDLDDLLARTLRLIEDWVSLVDSGMRDEIESHFIETLFLMAPPSYYRIRSAAGPQTVALFAKREAKFPEWIDIMNPPPADE